MNDTPILYHLAVEVLDVKNPYIFYRLFLSKELVLKTVLNQGSRNPIVRCQGMWNPLVEP